jgi:hypothetical protein
LQIQNNLKSTSSRNLAIDLDDNENSVIQTESNVVVVSNKIEDMISANEGGVGGTKVQPNKEISTSMRQNSRVTIWREQINAKNNVQEKIKKQV